MSNTARTNLDPPRWLKEGRGSAARVQPQASQGGLLALLTAVPVTAPLPADVKSAATGTTAAKPTGASQTKHRTQQRYVSGLADKVKGGR